MNMQYDTVYSGADLSNDLTTTSPQDRSNLEKNWCGENCIDCTKEYAKIPCCQWYLICSSLSSASTISMRLKPGATQITAGGLLSYISTYLHCLFSILNAAWFLAATKTAHVPRIDKLPCKISMGTCIYALCRSSLIGVYISKISALHPRLFCISVSTNSKKRANLNTSIHKALNASNRRQKWLHTVHTHAYYVLTPTAACWWLWRCCRLRRFLQTLLESL